MKYKVDNLKKRKGELKVLYKRCTKCNEIKCIKEFTKRNTEKTLDGRRNQCELCVSKRNSKQYICEYCGKEFLSKEYKPKFCSKECAINNRKRRVAINCEFCGKKISIKQSDYDKSEHHYCSRECQNKGHSLLSKGENNSNYNRIEYKCDGCGKLIKITPSELKAYKTHYCSKECYYKYHRGENHHCYNPNLTNEDREDSRQYEEYYEWRNSVFKRDCYTCVISGEKHNIVAHHLYSYSKYKNLRTDINNGITLSIDIHKEFHKKYGNKNNTLEQFEEFYKEKTGKDFKIN